MMTLPDATPVIQLLDAFRSSKAMFVAVSLGVFDCLQHRSVTAEQLAAELHCQADPLTRLLDACVALGLLRKTNGTYSNEPIACAYLCRMSPNSLVGYILYSNEVLYKLWGHLEDALREGAPQWGKISNQAGGIFEQFFRTDDSMHTFLKGMHGLGVLSSSAVVSSFDLSRFHTLVDLGGATGHLAIAACEHYPNLQAIIFDVPRVIAAVRDDISKSPVASRIQLVEGDFFDSQQLPDSDLFALGRILHDWPDERVVRLLTDIYMRLPPGGGILLSEKLLNAEKSGPTSALLQSLNMLVCTEGKERSLEEYRALLEAAGYRNVEGRVTGAPLDAIFAVKSGIVS